GAPAALRALRAGALPDRAARARRLRPRRHARSARALGAARPRRPPSRHPPRGKLSRWGPSVFSYFFHSGGVPSATCAPRRNRLRLHDFCGSCGVPRTGIQRSRKRTNWPVGVWAKSLRINDIGVTDWLGVGYAIVLSRRPPSPIFAT